MVAGEGEWLAGKESLEDMDGLLQAAHAHSCELKNHPGLLVLGAEPARPNPKLEPSTGEEIERRRFFRQHHRMPVVVVQHQAPYSEGPGGAGGCHQCNERGQLVSERFPDEVIADQQCRVAVFLCLVGLRYPFFSRLHVLADHSKTERS